MTGTSESDPSPGPGFPDDAADMSQGGGDESITFDYHRTVIGYHGTRRATAEELVRGNPFRSSENADDWLGHGIYFWEYAPQQAWWWAERRYGATQAAVVGTMIRLGRCFDLLDPRNGELLDRAHQGAARMFEFADRTLPDNANHHKYRDCIVFNYFYQRMAESGRNIDTSRAVFVPMGSADRYWPRSGVYRGSHIQICVRSTTSILSVWHVRRDGRYGLD